MAVGEGGIWNISLHAHMRSEVRKLDVSSISLSS